MRVLIALHDYLPDHLGGSELHAHHVAVAMRARGHEVTAVFTERRLERPQGDLTFGELDGVKTIEMVHWREYADVRETWEQRHPAEVFRSIVARVKPDVVHFHHLALWGAACVGVAKDAGAKVVLTLHDYHLVSERADLLHTDGTLCELSETGGCGECLRAHPLLPARWGAGEHPVSDEDQVALFQRAAEERMEYHRAELLGVDHTICPSEFLRGVFSRSGLISTDRSEQLFYGYPGPLAEPRRRDPNRPLRVGYVGGIYPSKGVHVLVEAMSELREEPIEAQIWGILDWFPDYVDQLRASSDGAKVELRGRLEPEDRDAVMTEFDCLVVPSIWYENMPLTIWEGYRNGLPVVTTNHGGMSEAVKHEQTGLCFERGSATALAACLQRLERDPELLYRLASNRPAIPSLDSVADRIETLYRK